VLFDLEPGARDRRCNPKSPLGELFRPGNLVNQNAGAGTTGPRATTQGLGTNSAESPCCVAAFVVNSEPHIGARPSVRVCVGPELTCCVLLYSSKFTLAAIYFRRFRVIGRSFAPVAQPLRKVSTVLRLRHKPRHGPTAALPGKDVQRGTWTDCVHCSCAACYAAKRANGHVFAKSVRFFK
jgi:hypothetical protein